MAVYNEILVGRFNRFLQKFLSMKGPASMNVLAPELQAQLAFLAGAESFLHQGWSLYSNAMGFGAGGAGNFATMRLRNPIPSNAIAVITGLFIETSGQTFDLSFNIVNSDLGAATPSAAWDTRGETTVTNVSSAIFSALNGVTSDLPFLLAVYNGTPGGANRITQEFPLLPGTSIQLRNTTANAAGIATIFWRERFLEESERTA